MKKILLMTTIAAIAGMGAMAQNVNIPDPVFKNYLLGNSAINTNGDDEIQESEAAAFTGTISYIGQESSAISDLTGIEAFTALTRIEVLHNHLSSLDLSANTALTYLDCSYNGIYDSLYGFYNFEPYLSSLDVSNCTVLDTLICSKNALTSLNLSANTALVYLDCSDNATIESGDLIEKDNSGYMYIGIYEYYTPKLSSIDLSGLTSLAYLNCSGNRLQTLDVNTNIALTYLDCSGNFSYHNNDYDSYGESNGYQDSYSETPYLLVLHISNGNNTLLEGQNFNATQNTALGCIEVDDVAYSQSNWSGSIDPTASFSEDCPAIEDITVSVTTANNAPATITTDMGTLQMMANVTPDLFQQMYYWYIIPVTGSASISPNGLVVANNGNATVYARAVSTVDPQKRDSMLITISNQLSLSIATENNVPAAITVDDGTLQMTAIVLPADTNQQVIWSIVSVTGDASVSEDGLVMALENGEVYVKAQSILNPARRDSMLITISNQNSTGIDDHKPSANNLFSLYPNPNNGRFIIEGPASGRGSYSLSISNVLGQKVFSQTEQVNGDKLHIEIAAGELVPGIYFLNVAKEGEQVAVKQFVINQNEK